MATPFLQAACLPTRERVRRPCVECGALLLYPIVPLIDPDYAARLPLRWFNTASVTSRRTPRRCGPVASVRRRSCSHQPETPDAVSSADLAFDQPLKGVPRSPGKTSASFPPTRVRASPLARLNNADPRSPHRKHMPRPPYHGSRGARGMASPQFPPMCPSSPLGCALDLLDELR
jgi:hypothetical protein